MAPAMASPMLRWVFLLGLASLETPSQTSPRDTDHIQTRQLSFASFDSSSLLGDGWMVEPSHVRPLRMEAGDEDSRVDQSGCPRGLYRASTPAPDVSVPLVTLTHSNHCCHRVFLKQVHTAIALKANWTFTNFAAPSIVPAGCGWCSTDFSTHPSSSSHLFQQLPSAACSSRCLGSGKLWDTTSEGLPDPSLA